MAHIVKFVLTLIASGGKVHDPGIFLRAGGMPSSHSSVIIATLTVIGARQGVGSAVFGLGVAVAAIIMYDAVNVRRSVGEQGDVLRKVAAHTKVDQRFFTAYGHSFTEVVGGVVVGLLVGWVLLQIL
jgi:acid phosphatase family membrane protein YuiD